MIAGMQFSCCAVGLLKLVFICSAKSNMHAHHQSASDQAFDTCLPCSPYANPRICSKLPSVKKAENEYSPFGGIATRPTGAMYPQGLSRVPPAPFGPVTVGSTGFRGGRLLHQSRLTATDEVAGVHVHHTEA